MGGETADVGDVVRTVAVNGTMTARWPKAKLVTNDAIAPGNVIVGFASFGQSVYESEYNSGLGSNGLTSARHDVLAKKYKFEYPESLDDLLVDEVAYIGKHNMTDKVRINYRGESFEVPVGKLLLSPTRTYAPLVKRILSEQFDAVRGMIHASGGGQTKCMKYMPEGVRVVKDNLFDAPEIFKLIQQSSGSDNREMYQVFNMGCRLEIYTEESAAAQMIATANSLGIEAQIIGRVEAGEDQGLVVKTGGEEIEYRF
jgi:phosphoribosylformylglycinamidine cyclo-ligase